MQVFVYYYYYYSVQCTKQATFKKSFNTAIEQERSLKSQIAIDPVSLKAAHYRAEYRL